MRRVCSLLIGVLALISLPAQAQTADDAFCALAPIPMLAALDGDWSLRQGAGVAVAGCCATVPLPPHPAQTLTLKYDPATGTATLAGAAPGESMIMVPTLTPENATQAIQAVGEAIWEDYQQIGPGCDWYAVPVMLGTNIYSLNSVAMVAQQAANAFVGSLNGVTFGYCYSSAASFFSFYQQSNGANEIYSETCDPFGEDWLPDIPTLSPGQMAMSLIMKFQSPSSGSGMLVFEGEKDGYQFRATAPVTLTR